jgi:hypothetical protein
MAVARTNTTSGTFLERGYVRNDDWNWTVGGGSGIIYVSTTSGSLTQTAPAGAGDVVQPVGIAISSDVIYFNPPLAFTIVAAP